MDILKDNFAQNLKEFRKKHNLTREELAKELYKKYGANINKFMIAKWEQGYPAELESIKVLSLYFDVSINELLDFNLKGIRNIKVLQNN